MELREKLEQLSAIETEMRVLAHFVGFGTDKIKIEYGNYDIIIRDEVLIEAIVETCSRRCEELEGKAKRLMGPEADLPLTATEKE